ncbi:UDP-galactopyranose mutase [Sphingomonas radiodurans]|uniref:UDP-galactopyranose mutase n=1 Tax=Sphingomonas radiodurans TaxID=2890321 RepID=UPI001E3C773C|nr:UDP-galactopyranose mutase [Sphingomonas radiodurans]WBH18143.1 UDP-galactopyranose mutase [Sphingomonas radiodurans]
MTRLAVDHAVIFWEEPTYAAPDATPRVCRERDAKSGVTVMTPVLPWGLPADEEQAILKSLLDAELASLPPVAVRWYYTPMMLPFSTHVVADCTVYDCMDELSAFKNPPAGLLDRERDLLAAADVVFTGGSSLYEAKKDRHDNVHAFPSSIEAAHFGAARGAVAEPEDQARILGPKLGFAGVVDERMDIDLLAALADAHDDWSIVVIGPVVKIDPASLPKRRNLHFLGGRDYAELPAYMSGWDVALMPFALNEATRFISPTKTPEYLAAGCPVVSTPITDVVRHYGHLAAVQIAGTAEKFISACETAVASRDDLSWRAEADEQLARGSWAGTVLEMGALIAIERATAHSVERIVSPTRWPAPATTDHDVMVVGAGFAGAVMARQLAEAGFKVLVVDRRPHVAGNAFDRRDDAGLLIHQYGPHIFHTNSDDVFAYLSRFTAWRPYEHRVLASVGEQLVPMPINRTTLNMLYDAKLETEDEVEAFLAARAEPVDPIRTSADVVISRVGQELYRTFFRGYTRKQWGLDPSELDKSVTSRVPTRANTDDRYFTDTHQAMPADGYTRMFEALLDHPEIELLLGVDYKQVRDAYPHDHLVFTGPIDEFFGHRHGKLPYRSLTFRHETIDREWLQPVAVVNYPDEAVPHTRITEYKHLTGDTSTVTSLTYEYPSEEGDPYYPIPREENQVLFKRYEALALAEEDVTFVGRLATYRYYNMDQVVGQALATARRLIPRLRARLEVPELTAEAAE